MGSSGSGNFSDYSGRSKSDDGASGGASGTDRCREAFTVSLEDVAHHDYFANHGSVPAVGAVLTIELKGRIVAVIGGESVGALPTSFNYLAGCLAEGFTYTGVVKASSSGINPQVHVDFVAD